MVEMCRCEKDNDLVAPAQWLKHPDFLRVETAAEHLRQRNPTCTVQSTDQNERTEAILSLVLAYREKLTRTFSIINNKLFVQVLRGTKILRQNNHHLIIIKLIIPYHYGVVCE